jgi:hypothetical protein
VAGKISLDSQTSYSYVRELTPKIYYRTMSLTHDCPYKSVAENFTSLPIVHGVVPIT